MPSLRSPSEDAMARRSPGATWVMRAPLRQERHDLSYVAIAKIAALRELSVGDREVSIGACVTHAELSQRACFNPGLPGAGLGRRQCGQSGHPPSRDRWRQSLRAQILPRQTLVPALLCLDAEIELQGPRGSERIPLSRFLEIRASLAPGQLVRRVMVPRTPRRSVHVRLPLRKPATIRSPSSALL